VSQDCLVDIIITMNKNCKGGTDMAQQKEGDSMGLFKKKNVKKSYDRECMKPVIRASICTGEQVAGFKDMQTGKLEEMIKVFPSEEVETEVVQLGGKPIADCFQCNVCQKTGKCVIKDDGVNEFVEKAKTADGFVFATPVYFAHPSGCIYDFLDRVFYSAGGYDAFKFKPDAAVAVARRGGTTAVLDGINKYFGIAQMPVAGSTYWNMVHIEGFYNTTRIHSHCGYESPQNFEKQYFKHKH